MIDITEINREYKNLVIKECIKEKDEQVSGRIKLMFIMVYF